MIISHKYKFIFIKLRKTAGTSLEIALSQYCDTEDIITPISKDDEIYRRSMGYSYPGNINIPIRHYKPKDWRNLLLGKDRKKYYNHMPASEIINSVSNEIWKNYYKFCFERNPWDKIISHYYHRNRSKNFTDIKDYLLNNNVDNILGYDMYTIDKEVVADKIFRYEEMESALSEISQTLGFKTRLKMPEYKAKSGFRRDNRSYREILTQEEANIITKRFEREIGYMGYSF